MNSDFPKDPRTALEASLTALLLGELPHDEASTLHQKLAQDAELARLYERLKQTINLVRETISSPVAQTAGQPTPPKLSAARREKLLQQFKTVAPREFVQPRRRAMPWLVPVGIAAALVVILGALFVPALSRSKGGVPSLAFGTWSLSKEAGPAGPAPAIEKHFSYGLDVSRNRQMRPLASEHLDRSGGASYVPSRQQTPPPAKPSGPAIVLPKVTELAYATTTSPVGESGNAWFKKPAPLRGYYDTASGRADVAAGGGGFGGFSSGGRGDVLAVEGRPAGAAVADDLFRQSGGKDSIAGVRPEEVRERLPAFGEPSQAAIAGDSISASVYGSDVPVAAPAPAPVAAPPPITAGVGALRDAVPAPAPELALAPPADGIEMAGAPMQTRATDAAAGELTARVQSHGLGQQQTDSHASAQLPEGLAANRSGSDRKLFAAPVAGGSFFALADGESGKAKTQEKLAAGYALAGKPASPVVNYGSATLARAAGELAGKSADTSDFNDAAAGNRNQSYQWGIGGGGKPSQTDADGDKFPMLGDVPATVRFYRTTPDTAGGGGELAARSPVTLPAFGKQSEVAANNGRNNLDLRVQGGSANNTLGLDFHAEQAPQANAIASNGDGRQASFGRATVHAGNAVVVNGFRMLPGEKVKGVDLVDDVERQQPVLEGQASRPDSRGEEVRGLNVVGYANGQLPVTKGFVAKPSTLERFFSSDQPSQPSPDANRALPAARSPIVLPPEPAPSLALKTGRNKDAQLFASADQPGAAPAILNGTQSPGAEEAAKSQPYFEAKRDLKELQRVRQVLDAKIASEKIDVTLPKTMMVEIADKAVPASSPSSTLWDKIRGKTGDYKSTARIKVERDQSDISGMVEHASTPSHDPHFIQTEAEAIQSEAVLGKVAEDLNLKESWAEKKGDGGKLTTAETVQLLKKSLDLRPVQNTGLLEIGVRSDKPEEAAKIANALAETYKARRLEQRSQLSQAGIKAVEERYALQDEKVREAQKKVDDLRVKLNISDALASGDAPSPLVSANAPRMLERMRPDTKTDAASSKPAAPAPVPQPEVPTAENSFSTFSLNVSDVAFKLAAASLEKGLMPEPANVRSEEFINAFDYRDPEPPPGVPVAFAWDRAHYPFAQNRDLLRFSIKTAALGRQPGRPLNLVLLLDNSGSMERADRVRIIREALRVLAGQLQPQDKFSVVTFARSAHLWVDGVPGNQAAKVAEEVSGLTPQGGTNLEDAMNLAYQTALRHYLANGINRVVLLTDGAANLGSVDAEALKQKVEANRKQGIALDCFGIGWEGYNDDLLEALSRNGDGRYAFLNTAEEVASEFATKLAGALQVAASDVKVQVEFNPARVTAYRQIGYAKHQLTKEQFRDNTVNAAQIGAAEAGNALYTVEVNPAGTGPLCTVRARFQIPGTADYREHAWDVPFAGNAVTLEQASPAMRLAASASALSEWLASSPYAGEVTPDRLLGYLSGVPEIYGADARPKKLEWMIRQAKSIAGK